MVPEKISEAERALLTEEELEGLMEDEGDEGADEDGDEEAGADAGDGAADAAAAGDGDEDAAKAAADAAAKAAADAPAAAAAANPDPAAAAADAVPDAGAAVVTEEEPPQRTPSWSLPSSVGERIKAIDGERDQLAVEFDDGSMTAGELREKLRLLENEREGLLKKQISAEVALDFAKNKWIDEAVPDFMKQNPQYNTSAVLYQALDAEVKKLQAASVNPFDPKILVKAHATIAGEITKAFNVKADNTNPTPKDTPKPGTKVKRDAVPTLAHVPAADITDADDGGEFAYIERLAETDSLAYEKELAKLSPEKLDRFLAQ